MVTVVIEEVDMNSMMDGVCSQGAMGLVGFLVITALVLTIAALIKYLFFSKT